MTSSARADFLKGLGALNEAAADPFVIGNTDPAAFVRRGMAVALYNLLETYVFERVGELAAFVSSGQLNFGDLPTRLQGRAVRSTLNVAASRVKYVEDVDLAGFTSPLGASLSSVSGPAVLSGYVWGWPGSNMGSSDYFGALRGFHVRSPAETVRVVSGQLGFQIVDPNGSDLKMAKQLTDFANARHEAAHNARHSVSALWLRGTSDLALKFAVCFDALASVGASFLRANDAAFVADEDHVGPSSIVLRSVEQRGSDFAEYFGTRRRAKHVDRDGDALFRAAATRCGKRELLVALDRAGNVTNWAVPEVS